MTRKQKPASSGGVSRRLASAVLVTLAALRSITPVEAQDGGDALRGQHVFRKCATCHVINPSSTALLAPPLQGVIGRAAATIPGFEYSDIMKIAGQRGLVWTKDALFHFLDRPDQFIPGTYMTFAGLEPGERADVIAYLETLNPPKNKSEPAAPPAAPKDKESNAARDADRPRASSAPSATSNRPRSRSEARSESSGTQSNPP